MRPFLPMQKFSRRWIFLHFFDGIEQVLGQPIVSHRSVVTFDIRVLLRVARLDKHQRDPILFSPSGQESADVFRTVVTADLSGFPPATR